MSCTDIKNLDLGNKITEFEQKIFLNMKNDEMKFMIDNQYMKKM